MPEVDHIHRADVALIGDGRRNRGLGRLGSGLFRDHGIGGLDRGGLGATVARPAVAPVATIRAALGAAVTAVLFFFLGAGNEELVLTGRLVNLLGSRGGNWEILTASAFITIIVPLIVFFSLQRFLVRGLLSGSVKGG